MTLKAHGFLLITISLHSRYTHGLHGQTQALLSIELKYPHEKGLLGLKYSPIISTFLPTYPIN